MQSWQCRGKSLALLCYADFVLPWEKKQQQRRKQTKVETTDSLGGAAGQTALCRRRPVPPTCRIDLKAADEVY